jgi:hypothetical protein
MGEGKDANIKLGRPDDSSKCAIWEAGVASGGEGGRLWWWVGGSAWSVGRTEGTSGQPDESWRLVEMWPGRRQRQTLHQELAVENFAIGS